MKYFSDKFNKKRTMRPPDLYEYFVDNFWFKAADFENQKINAPLRGSHKADIVIVGGGYTGLSAAYNIIQKCPNKKIVLLEGARCGYGASGRNGGFCVATQLLNMDSDVAPGNFKKSLDVSFHGLEQIKGMISEHGVDCDFEENGMLEVAMNEKQASILRKRQRQLQSFGLEATFIQGKELEAEIKSPRFIAGLIIPYGATLNPAKLVLGMKRVVEDAGVEIRERSVVTRITPGKINRADTELGDISAPVFVIATNAYSHKLGFFQNRVLPICTFIIATETLSREQWEAIGWQNRQGLYDLRTLFNYSIPSADGRIIIGGSDYLYYANDNISSGNDKSVTDLLEKDLFATFPQLEGLRIEHAWGGTTAMTLDYTPSIGVIGDHKNIYYGVGYNEGVPTAQTAGRIIADLIAGESNDFTNHHIVNHNIPYAGTRYLRTVFADLAHRLGIIHPGV